MRHVAPAAEHHAVLSAAACSLRWQHLLAGKCSQRLRLTCISDAITRPASPLEGVVEAEPVANLMGAGLACSGCIVRTHDGFMTLVV